MTAPAADPRGRPPYGRWTVAHADRLDGAFDDLAGRVAAAEEAAETARTWAVRLESMLAGTVDLLLDFAWAPCSFCGLGDMPRDPFDPASHKGGCRIAVTLEQAGATGQAPPPMPGLEEAVEAARKLQGRR